MDEHEDERLKGTFGTPDETKPKSVCVFCGADGAENGIGLTVAHSQECPGIKAMFADMSLKEYQPPQPIRPLPDHLRGMTTMHPEYKNYYGPKLAQSCPNPHHQFLITDLTARCNRLHAALERAKEELRNQISAEGFYSRQRVLKEIESIEKGVV